MSTLKHTKYKNKSDGKSIMSGKKKKKKTMVWREKKKKQIDG